MCTRFPSFAAILALTLGLWGCDDATVREFEVQEAPLDVAGLAADEGEACHAFWEADGDTSTSSSAEADSVGESSAELVTVCRIRVDNPHRSTHVPGTVNLMAVVECNRAVSAIDMMIRLTREGREISRFAVTNAGNSSLRGNAAAPCVSGIHQGSAEAAVAHPRGSWPLRGTLSKTSSSVYINCD